MAGAGLKYNKWDFIHLFYISNKKNVQSRSLLGKVVQMVSATGSFGDVRIKDQRHNIDQEKVALTKNPFEENPKTSLRRASYDLHITKCSIHKTLKNTLKFKPYKSAQVPALSKETRRRRMEVFTNFLKKDFFLLDILKRRIKSLCEPSCCIEVLHQPYFLLY